MWTQRHAWRKTVWGEKMAISKLKRKACTHPSLILMLSEDRFKMSAPRMVRQHISVGGPLSQQPPQASPSPSPFFNWNVSTWFWLTFYLKNDTCLFKTKSWKSVGLIHISPLSQMRMLMPTETSALQSPGLSLWLTFCFLGGWRMWRKKRKKAEAVMLHFNYWRRTRAAVTLRASDGALCGAGPSAPRGTCSSHPLLEHGLALAMCPFAPWPPLWPWTCLGGLIDGFLGTINVQVFWSSHLKSIKFLGFLHPLPFPSSL